MELLIPPDGEAFLMQPVLQGLCRYESLLDGTLDLADIARLNYWISINNENNRRINSIFAGNL